MFVAILLFFVSVVTGHLRLAGVGHWRRGVSPLARSSVQHIRRRRRRADAAVLVVDV